MIILALAAAVMQPVPPVQEVPEIVVIGRRLQSLSVWVARDPKGRLHCGMNGSTGHDRLDQRLCKAAAQCVKKGAGATADVNRCVAASKPKLLDQVRRELEARRR